MWETVTIAVSDREVEAVKLYRCVMGIGSALAKV